MAFTEITCRSGGNNLYAGSLDGSAEASTTPLVTYTGGTLVAATGVFTVASGDPVAAGVAVGMWASVYADGASAPTGYVGRVTARTTTTITVSTTAKSGTSPTDGTANRTLVVGGAWAGPSGASGFPFGFVQSTMTDASSNAPRVNFKNDQTHSITAAMTHANNGPINWEGYTAAFGDGGLSTIDGGTSGASYILLTNNSQSNWHDGLKFQNNGATGSAGLVATSGQRSFWRRCVFSNSRGYGLTFGGGGQNEAIECEAFTCNTSNTANAGGFMTSSQGSRFIRCVSHDHSAGANCDGFYLTGATLIDCIADTCAGQGVRVASFFADVFGGAFHNNTGAGILVAGTSWLYAENAICASNGGYGVNGSSIAGMRLYNLAFHSNTSGQVNGSNAVVNTGPITLTGDPFVDAANGDFDLNNTAGAGAACRGVGRGAFTQTAASYAGALGYPDIGAAQHQDAGGASGTPAFASVG